MTFTIIAAIDILDGKCVRLEKGNYDKVTIYGSPIEMAKKWQETGFEMLHIVDLDGARSGSPANLAAITEIARTVNIPVEVGGGIRNLDTAKELIESGVCRIILGTVAFENLGFLKTLIESYGDKIAVSLDAKKNIVLTKGWVESTKIKVADAAKRLMSFGVKRFVYTDISKDGMLAGPNFSGIKKFAKGTDALVVASGGVSSDEDIIKLSKLCANVDSCIAGKALYEGKITLTKVL